MNLQFREAQLASLPVRILMLSDSSIMFLPFQQFKAIIDPFGEGNAIWDAEGLLIEKEGSRMVFTYNTPLLYKTIPLLLEYVRTFKLGDNNDE